MQVAVLGVLIVHYRNVSVEIVTLTVLYILSFLSLVSLKSLCIVAFPILIVGADNFLPLTSQITPIFQDTQTPGMELVRAFLLPKTCGLQWVTAGEGVEYAQPNQNIFSWNNCKHLAFALSGSGYFILVMSHFIRLIPIIFSYFCALKF